VEDGDGICEGTGLFAHAAAVDSHHGRLTRFEGIPLGLVGDEPPDIVVEGFDLAQVLQ